jgi:hypothetical protein
MANSMAHSAAELILPEIVRRSDKDVTKISWAPTQGEPLGYFFDVEYLNHTLAMHCPQMKVHASLDDLYNVPGLLDPVKIKVLDIGREVHNGTVLTNPHVWHIRLQDYLNHQSPPAKRKYPMRIHLEEPALYSWPVSSDPP